MEDNTPQRKSGSLPPLPSSSASGRMPPPSTHLPPIKKGGPGKIVVMLSSVAKPAPAGTQALPRVPAPVENTPTATPTEPAKALRRPPPLPPKVSRSAPPLRLNATTYVKLPPKTSVPQLASLSGAPIPAPVLKEPHSVKTAPPPLPPKWGEPIRGEPRKTGIQNIPPIKLNAPSTVADSPAESIFPDSAPEQAEAPPKPEAPVKIEPPAPAAENTQHAEELERLRRLLQAKPPSREPEEKEKPPGPKPPPPFSSVAPEAAPPAPDVSHLVHPPPVPPAAPAEGANLHPLHVAPPLLEKGPELPHDKLRPPRPAAAPPPVPATEPGAYPPPQAPAGPKAATMIPSELPLADKPLLAVPAKPAPPVVAPVGKSKGPVAWLKNSVPLVLSSSSAPLPKVAEARAALKPPVLPKRSIPPPPAVTKNEEPVLPFEPLGASPEAGTALPKDPPPAEMISPPQPPQPAPVAASVPLEKKQAASITPPPAVPPVKTPTAPIYVPTTAASKPALPATRAARARKRRWVETAAFYFVFALTLIGLYYGGLYFGRETRVEGQVIPPPGMTLNNEVWIVSDFRELASGIAEDLAAERTPLVQEVQEKQEHVQRAQADVATREERIRLIQEEIQSSKDEMASLAKQSRQQTQQIWDGEGGQIQAEYNSHLEGLQRGIFDRAKSLKLNYQPDPTYQSPEVWANAYRLALYEVPPGVDAVKEHQWLGDQMTGWRNFLKTLDDRKAALRQKADQIKTDTGPKIADLQAKIDDSQQRSDATAAEEVPLKAELQQAQADLVKAQSADEGLDDKYYKQLDALPEEAITKHIPLSTNGRFTWVTDDPFAEGEKEHSYWIFSRATRSDGRQYWALHHFSISQDQKMELTIEPTGFVSTKAILRPNLSPEEQEQ